MQSMLFCGRLISRALFNGVYNNSPQQSTTRNTSQSTSTVPSHTKKTTNNALRLVTAVSGFSKCQDVDKVVPGKFGDDAYFVAHHQLGDVIGVADGVGGWRQWGVDPGQFSQSLMQACEKLVVQHTSSGSAIPQAHRLLSEAYDTLQSQAEQVSGSSTACIVMVRALTQQYQASPDHTRRSPPVTRANVSRVASTTVTAAGSGGGGGLLSSANIGDSGYLVVREGHIVHRSEEQQHYFNTPFQLSLPPPGISEHVLADSPSSAVTSEFEVRAGDLLLVATDGVFDNLPVSSILKHLKPLQSSADLNDLQRAANIIAKHARKHSLDPSFLSPFARRAQENGIDTVGGKPDDITVVVARILA